jgi:phosphatidylserine/phosphatidylglycerophosphate/cardiolipin synthase-like enzyme
MLEYSTDIHGVYWMVCKKACIITAMVMFQLVACGRSDNFDSDLSAESTDVASDFSFNLLTSDIRPWVKGMRSGPMGDEKGKQAVFLENLIKSSRSEMMVGLYGVQSQPWFFSSIGMQERKNVRFVVDQQAGALNDWIPENFNYPDTAELGQSWGETSVIPDLNPSGTPRTATIMHNKFVVLKNKGVWTGSTNVSATCLGSEYNANASIYIANAEVAKIYEAEFKQMFEERRFSRYKLAKDRKPLSFRDGTKLEVFFSPQDIPVHNAIIPFIENSKKTLDIGMFVLTHPEIIDAIRAAAIRGVKVRIIGDALFSNRETSPIDLLKEAGVEIRVENWGGKMHMKSAVADGKRTVIGSMNWTKSGEVDNDENTLVIDNKKLATQLTKYFNDLWDLLRKDEGRIASAESLLSINSCFDEIDNDYDGLIDAEEAACKK